jgi:hypothetical protein
MYNICSACQVYLWKFYEDLGNVKHSRSNFSALYAVGDYTVNATLAPPFTSFAVYVNVLIYKRAWHPLISDVTAMVVAVPCISYSR